MGSTGNSLITGRGNLIAVRDNRRGTGQSGQDGEARMAGIEVVTTSDRPDLDDQARAAFRGEWPEFIFHDPVSAAHIGRVEEYFAHYDILLLDDGEGVAGGWGVPIQWDGSVFSLPDGYDGSLVRAVGGHEDGTAPDTLSVMAAAVKRG